jgi:hypothetical protein
MMAPGGASRGSENRRLRHQALSRTW